jgi:hypothetical protein
MVVVGSISPYPTDDNVVVVKYIPSTTTSGPVDSEFVCPDIISSVFAVNAITITTKNPNVTFLHVKLNI